ncbi:MAG: GTP 3',8-cyclase MoaA [Fluviicola sp. XM-24bin1]|nr:MAG: GTP 3',8-cyclase MoaA [Fluviicola sp. XM-24bin1]
MKNAQEHIVDSFGRRHNYLRISLTEKCNLRCFYCMPLEGVPHREAGKFMTTEEVVGIAQEFVRLGVDKIRLTGGEPLVKKGAEDIIRALGKLPITLSLTTNGILVYRFIDVFKEAGITSLNVSLDSLQEDRFNAISRRSYFKQIMENIQLLLDHDFRVKINVVLIKGTNDDEIVDFVQWSVREQISVQFIEFMPFDGNNWDREKTVSEGEILATLDDHFGKQNIEKLEDSPNSTSRNFKIDGAKGSFGIISTVTNPFCDSCNRIRLTADGKIKNCLFSNDEADLLQAFRQGNDLTPIIQTALFKKKAGLGGLRQLDNETIDSHENRSMITIGG